MEGKLKYKLLLSGRDRVAVDDFFQLLGEDFELQTTSMRYDDIFSHLNYYAPHAFVICLRDEGDEIMNVIAMWGRKLAERSIPLVIVGSSGKCDEFQRITGMTGSLVLERPVSMPWVRDRVLLFLKKWYAEKEKEKEKEREQEREREREREQEKEQQEKEQQEKERQEKERQEKERQEKERQEKERQESDAAQPPVKKHILVVDDDPMVLKLMKEQLKDSYMVGTAISGAIALKFLENKKTDLIILDYEMPVENGAQVLEKIRKNEATARLPVIFLTGINDRDKIKKVLEMKPQGYLLKPIDREKMLEAVKNVIG